MSGYFLEEATTCSICFELLNIIYLYAYLIRILHLIRSPWLYVQAGKPKLVHEDDKVSKSNKINSDRDDDKRKLEITYDFQICEFSSSFKCIFLIKIKGEHVNSKIGLYTAIRLYKYLNKSCSRLNKLK